jgi:hypothetical protein
MARGLLSSATQANESHVILLATGGTEIRLNAVITILPTVIEGSSICKWEGESKWDKERHTWPAVRITAEEPGRPQ